MVDVGEMSDLEVIRAYSNLCMLPIFVGAPLMLISGYIAMRPDTPIAVFDGVEYLFLALGAAIILGSMAVFFWGDAGGTERMRRCLRKFTDGE